MDKYITHKKHLIARCEQRGYSVEEVMPCVIEQRENDIWVIDVMHPAYPAQARVIEKTPEQDIGQGVGTELKRLLSFMNIHATANCSCVRRAKTMNKNGLKWCKDNKDEIIGWLKEEADKRKLPFFNYGAKKLLQLAIHRAEKKESNTCSS